MSTTLPTYSRAIDDYFVTTWDQIMKDGGADNIMLGTPVFAALKQRGCVKPQTGGYNVDRNISYALPTVAGVAKGDVLPSGETPTETMGLFPFRNLAVAIQRDSTDDVANAGASKIRDYVETRIKSAKNAMKQQMEVEPFNALDDGTDAARLKHYLGLNDLVPPHASQTSSTYGGIARANTWWQPKYKQKSANPEINYVPDLNNFYNTIAANLEPPNLIITDQTNYELYQDAALNQSQLIKVTGGGQVATLADLGFQTIMFNGKEMIWTPNITAGDTLMLNTDYIEFVYDPQMWFSMTEWKSAPLSMTRVAHILCRGVILSDQLRRHGRMYDANNA